MGRKKNESQWEEGQEIQNQKASMRCIFHETQMNFIIYNICTIYNRLSVCSCQIHSAEHMLKGPWTSFHYTWDKRRNTLCKFDQHLVSVYLNWFTCVLLVLITAQNWIIILQEPLKHFHNILKRITPNLMCMIVTPFVKTISSLISVINLYIIINHPSVYVYIVTQQLYHILLLYFSIL